MPTELAGRTAVDLLLDQLVNPQRTQQVSLQQVSLSSSFVARGSSGLVRQPGRAGRSAERS